MKQICEVSNYEYHYVYHWCWMAWNDAKLDESRTAGVDPSVVHYIAVPNDAKVIVYCPYCGERVT